MKGKIKEISSTAEIEIDWGRSMNINRKRMHKLLIVASLILVPWFSLGAEIDWAGSKNEYGHPDLQGNWTNPFQTPLERPLNLGMRRAYTKEEANALMDRALAVDIERRGPISPNRLAPKAGSSIGQQADGNFEIMPIELASINGEYRTSYIVDPADGRLPYRADALDHDIYGIRRSQGYRRFDGPENLSPLDRCLSATQLPLLRAFLDVDVDGGGNPGGDNPVRNIQIVQNQDYVVILSEYFSLVRIIRLSDNHILEQGRKWMGDSIAYYENDSLIVHTKNFRPEQSTAFLRSSTQFEIKETFTRIAEDEMLFEFTVTDPQIYSQDFTAEMSLKLMPPHLKLYEYACHEGNYSLPSILRAVRMEEQGLLN